MGVVVFVSMNPRGSTSFCLVQNDGKFRLSRRLHTVRLLLLHGPFAMNIATHQLHVCPRQQTSSKLQRSITGTHLVSKAVCVWVQDRVLTRDQHRPAFSRLQEICMITTWSETTDHLTWFGGCVWFYIRGQGSLPVLLQSLRLRIKVSWFLKTFCPLKE